MNCHLWGPQSCIQTFLNSVPWVFLLGLLVLSSDSTRPLSTLLLVFFFSFFFLLLVWSLLLGIKRSLTHHVRGDLGAKVYGWVRHKPAGYSQMGMKLCPGSITSLLCDLEQVT